MSNPAPRSSEQLAAPGCAEVAPYEYARGRMTPKTAQKHRPLFTHADLANSLLVRNCTRAGHELKAVRSR